LGQSAIAENGNTVAATAAAPVASVPFKKLLRGKFVMLNPSLCNDFVQSKKLIVGRYPTWGKFFKVQAMEK
jgi:hypothetical protein